METRQLNTQEVWQIYQEKMKQDFPPSELRPYSSMEKLMKSGEYLCFGCFEGDTLAAYAYFVVSRGRGPAGLLCGKRAYAGPGSGRPVSLGATEFCRKIQSPFPLDRGGKREQRAELPGSGAP